MASNGNRLGTMLNLTMHWTGPTTKKHKPKMSVMLRVRKAALEKLTNRGLKAGGGRCGGWVRKAPNVLVIINRIKDD